MVMGTDASVPRAQSTWQTTTSPARALCPDFADRIFSLMVLPGILKGMRIFIVTREVSKTFLGLSSDHVGRSTTRRAGCKPGYKPAPHPRYADWRGI